MAMTEEEKQELREKIVAKINERYEQSASQCAQVQEQYIKELEQVAHSQLNQSKHGGGEYASLTIREILEMERSS